MLMINRPMPKSCGYCCFIRNDFLYPFCMLHGDIVEEYLDEDRHPDCPLIEVTKCENCEHYTSATARC